MDKLGRNYELTVQLLNGDTLVVGLPFTIEFDIIRNTLSSANVCQMRIYNLSPLKRNQLRFNVYEFATFLGAELKAGYGNNLATIFKGNVTQAWSVREGTNFITQLESYDGGFAFTNARTDVVFPSGTQHKEAIKAVASTLQKQHIETGVIGDYTGKLSRGNSHSGNTMDVMNDMTNGGTFIDNGKVNALKNNEYIANEGGTILVNAKSGLLGTPVLENNLIRFDMLFEPSLNVGRKILLNSLTANANFNGEYKITSIKHRGMISESVCGSVITTGEFVRFGELKAAG